MKRNQIIVSACFLLLNAVPLWAEHPDAIPISFSYTWDVGFGREVYVAGGHENLGDWDPKQAVKLRWTPGNVWTGAVALPFNASVECKFIARTNSAATYSDAGNVEWMAGSNLVIQTPAGVPPVYTGKTVYYYSSWTNAFLLYRSGSTNWVDEELSQVGIGRNPGEFLYRRDGVGVEGEGIEFVLHGYSGGLEFWDNAPYEGYGDPLAPNYYTEEDGFLVQDKNVFTYWPASTVSPPRVVTGFVASTVVSLPGRTVKTYLPRGYDEHLWRAYPVFYLHDGQNVFSPGGGPGSVDADITATREISQGRARESILVAIDNDGANRLSEYQIPGDSFPVFGDGRADEYAVYLASNVIPHIESTYRTRTNRIDRLCGGASMGGLVSLYLGRETSLFGKVAVLSPAFTHAPNYTASLSGGSHTNLRVYMDFGTQETDGFGGDYWNPPYGVYDALLDQGYVPEGDLQLRVGEGHAHNEFAWMLRLPDAVRYLLPLKDEPAYLLQEDVPIEMTVGMDTNVLNIQAALLRHQQTVLEHTPNLETPVWSNLTSALVTSQSWNQGQWVIPLPADSTGFFRIETVPEF